MAKLFDFIQIKQLNFLQKKMRRDSKIKQEWDSQSQYSPKRQLCKKLKELPTFKLSKQKSFIETESPQSKRRIKKGQYFWNETQNMKYLQFVEKNIELMMKPLKERKALKVNILMSKYIKTRTASQCRSHHQKMLQSHNNIINLLGFLRGSKQPEKCQTSVEIEQSAPLVQPPIFELKLIQQTDTNPLSLWESLLFTQDLICQL